MSYMVLCWIALPILAVLGIFSAKYRKLTQDSLACLFHTVTLRKCTSGLDQRIKSHLTGTILNYTPRGAKFVHKYYGIITWMFVLIMLWSLIVSGIGIYNFAIYGNCNGPEETGFCVLDPFGEYTGHSSIDGSMQLHADCTVDYTPPEHPLFPGFEDNDPILGNQNASFTIIEYGCYTCEFTKRAEAINKEILALYPDVNIQFRSFIIPNHPLAFETALAAECAFTQNKYESFHHTIFATDVITNETLQDIAKSINLDIPEFEQCMSSKFGADEINADTQTGVNAGIIATPTYFIGNQTIVGTKPLKTFRNVIDKETGRDSAFVAWFKEAFSRE